MKHSLSQLALAGVLLFGGAVSASAQTAATAKYKSVVLVHGAFADGSGWQEVYKRLIKDGYKVLVVQNPTSSLDTDVEYTKRVIAMAGAPVVLVGHSYGGAVITQAGNDPNVKALVYIAAFSPDNGESAYKLATEPVPGAVPPPFTKPQDGFILLDPSKFVQAFAQDVAPAQAKFMAISQVPWATAAASGVITEAAWHSKQAWTLVTTQDHMIAPATQLKMAKRSKAYITQIPSSHSVFLSHPDVVVAMIERAAHGTAK